MRFCALLRLTVLLAGALQTSTQTSITGQYRRVTGVQGPPGPHHYRLLWPPTYVMNRSTMTHPDGNSSGPEGPTRLAVDARYGLLAFDGGFQGCLSARGSYGSCQYAQKLSVIEEQARTIKSLNPRAHVFTYRNIELALSRDWEDCSKMYDSRFSGFFLHGRDGRILNDAAPPINVSLSPECRAVDSNQTHYSQRDQFFIDWRNASAVAWWLDEVVGSATRSRWVDGFFWDDTPATGGLGSEHKSVLSNFSPSEIKAIDAAMLAAFTAAEHRLAAAGKWAMSYPDADDMNAAMPTPEQCVPMPCGHTRGGLQPNDCQACGRLWAQHYNCTCDRRPSTCLTRLRAAASVSDRPAMMTLPYPATNNSVACVAPAAVGASGARPLQLSCVPGTGVMHIEFASFGQPTVQRSGQFVRCVGAGCKAKSLAAVYWRDDATGTAYPLRPTGKYSVGGDTGCAACLRTRSCPVVPVNVSSFSDISERAFSCAVMHDCTIFSRNASCDAGHSVLHRVQMLCEGKQSCRVDPNEFKQPMGCGKANHMSLAVRTSGCAQGEVDAGFRESLAAFLLTRGAHAFMGHGWIANSPAVWFPDWDVDFGEPLGPMSIEGNVARRSWTNFDIALDCDSFVATFDPK